MPTHPSCPTSKVEHVNHLRRVYDLLQSKQVPNVYFLRHTLLTSVILSPRETTQPPKTGEELLSVDPGDQASSIVYKGDVGFHAIIISFIFILLFLRYCCKVCFACGGYAGIWDMGNLTYTGYTGGNICIYSSVVSSCIFELSFLFYSGLHRWSQFVLRPSHLPH